MCTAGCLLTGRWDASPGAPPWRHSHTCEGLTFRGTVTSVVTVTPISSYLAPALFSAPAAVTASRPPGKHNWVLSPPLLSTGGSACRELQCTCTVFSCCPKRQHPESGEATLPGALVTMSSLAGPDRGGRFLRTSLSCVVTCQDLIFHSLFTA